MRLSILVSLLLFLPVLSFAKGISPVEELGRTLGESLRQLYTPINNTCDVEGGFYLDDKKYCYFIEPPAIELATSEFSERMRSYFKIDDIPSEREGEVNQIIQKKFQSIEENRKAFFEKCAKEFQETGKKDSIICSGITNISQYKPKTRTILSAHIVSLTEAGSMFVLQQGSLVFEKEFLILRYNDNSDIISGISPSGDKIIEHSTGQEQIMTLEGEDIWHNRFGLLNMM